MECHDAKLLLAFARRKCENLAAAEHAALEQHLGACPDCAAFANAERRFDATFGKVMLDVPVPADLAQKVMQRLAAQRPVTRWKTYAAAAAVLLAAIGIGLWHTTQPTEVTAENLIGFVVEPLVGMPRAEVERYLADEGVHVKAPDDFEYDYLRHAEVIEFRNHRIGKLTFRRQFGNGVSVEAHVLILPRGQFRVDSIPDGQLNHATSIEVKRVGEFTYVIYHHGNLGSLRRPNIAA